MMGTPRLMQCCTTFSLKPGLTMKRAPASSARSTCSQVRTVPAPTSMSGTCFATFSIAFAAEAVRKVISASGRPPGAHGLGQRLRLVRILDLDDRDDAQRADLFQNAVHFSPP